MWPANPSTYSPVIYLSVSVHYSAILSMLGILPLFRNGSMRMPIILNVSTMIFTRANGGGVLKYVLRLYIRFGASCRSNEDTILCNQKILEAECPGATIIPIIISSDKTQITLFRNKTAYPVYLTIGNLPKEIRRKPSRQGQILLAYLPTTRLDHITNKAARRRTLANLFHSCMSRILAPLRDAGINGIVMASGDGVKRRCHPILAAYIGDYPEQCLVTGAYTGDCPVCDCPHDDLGSFPCEYDLRDLDKIMDAFAQLGTPDFTQACLDANIKPLQHPFWEDLPYVDIFQSITPDILHQLYQGVFKHLLSWLTDVCGAAEIDARVRRLPSNHGIRIFHKGITSLSRVSGTEHKQMSRFLLGLIVDVRLPGNLSSQSLFRATRSLLDFLYLAQYPVHTDATLTALDDALQEFHANREIFVELGIRDNFNIPKLHFLEHYVRCIKLFGTTDNFNTEATERLHIDFAKDAYRATNHKDEFPQMTKWLERREKILYHSNYVAWRIQQPVIGPPTVATHSVIRWQPPDMACSLHHKMTRHPTRKAVSIEEITSPTGYGAVNFVAAFARFVVQYNNPTLSPRQVEELAADVHLPFRTLPVFHRIKFWNQAVHGKDTLDSIHVHPRRVDEDEQVIVPARFDTALIQVRNIGTGQQAASLQGLLFVFRQLLIMKLTGIIDMRVGQVHLIFSIPEAASQQLFPHGNKPPSHLVYIEWFSKFNASPDPNLKMYKIRRSLQGNERLASIVPLKLLQRSVHLIPKWGPAVPSHWTSENVLDECEIFFLNSFKDMHTYFNVY